MLSTIRRLGSLSYVAILIVYRVPTLHNDVEVLIDGQETFKRYYEIMMAAQHSIKILAWEMSLSFGLVKAKSVHTRPTVCDENAKWINLEVLETHEVLKFLGCYFG